MDFPWTIRFYEEHDLPAIVDLVNQCDRADGLDKPASISAFQAQFARSDLAPTRQVLVAEKIGQTEAAQQVPSNDSTLGQLPDGTLIAFGRAFPSGSGEQRTYGLMLRVHKAARSKGLERIMARRLLEVVRAEESRPDVEPAHSVRLRTYLFPQHASVIGVMEQIGLRRVREGWTMSRQLEGKLEEPPPLKGLTVRTYRVPQDNERVLMALNIAFADYYDFHPLDNDRWNHEMQASYVRPDLSWLAIDEAGEDAEIAGNAEKAGDVSGNEGEEGPVAGFAICWIDEEQNRQSGIEAGWIEGMGVVPGRRRQGVGRNLLHNSLRSLQAAGMSVAMADVDAGGDPGSSPAVALFRSLGFTPREVLLQLECRLDPATLENRS
jgi:ribosomal protein S18 acetylase RimI-like enzyme